MAILAVGLVDIISVRLKHLSLARSLGGCESSSGFLMSPFAILMLLLLLLLLSLACKNKLLSLSAELCSMSAAVVGLFGKWRKVFPLDWHVHHMQQAQLTQCDNQLNGQLHQHPLQLTHDEFKFIVRPKFILRPAATATTTTTKTATVTSSKTSTGCRSVGGFGFDSCQPFGFRALEAPSACRCGLFV